MTSLNVYSASELSELFCKGDLSAREIVESCFKQIELLDPSIGAFLSLSKERAYEKADHLDKKRARGEKLGLLAAFPVAVKDNIHVKGEISSCGSKILQNYRAPFSATSVSRLEEAGAIPIGKTNMDEFGMGSSTENSALQKTVNPWDKTCVPGGSSGGSAAAVAAKMVPVALGSDTGGSVRQPASLTGILGFKPTYGRVSRFGLVAYGSSLDTIGTMGRSVLDIEKMMEIMSGPCPHDSTSLKKNEESFLGKEETPLKGMRVGVPWHFLEDLSEEARSLFEGKIGELKKEGAIIVDVDLNLLRLALPVYYILATAEASTNLARFDGIRYGLRNKEAKTLEDLYGKTREEGFGAEVKRRILLGTFVLSSGFQDSFYKKAQKVRTLLIEMYQRAFSDCDLIATPTSPFEAFKRGAIKDPVQMYLEDIYTIGVNLAGLPAISLPALYTSSGKPMGFQLTAPFAQDAYLLRTARAFESRSLFVVKTPKVSIDS